MIWKKLRRFSESNPNKTATYGILYDPVQRCHVMANPKQNSPAAGGQGTISIGGRFVQGYLASPAEFAHDMGNEMEYGRRVSIEVAQAMVDVLVSMAVLARFTTCIWS